MWRLRRADGVFLHRGISNLACGADAPLVILRNDRAPHLAKAQGRNRACRAAQTEAIVPLPAA